jgi:hypothetical protein
MGKVLVERPRLRHHSGYSGPGKGYHKQMQKWLDAGDSPPSREGMKERYGEYRKHFNENLAPLRRFLQANVGRPWNKVYAEICKHIDRDNVVQKHILTHLFQYVITRVVMIDGQPCRTESYAGRRYGEPLRTSHDRYQWYVCPKSGLLRKSKYVPRHRKSVSTARRVVLSKSQMCLHIGGQWELVTVAPFTGLQQPRGYDVILKRGVYSWSGSDCDAMRLYGANVYATARRPLSRRELRMLPIPGEWLR